MKTALKTLALVIALSPLAAFAAGQTVDVKITGMSCGACVDKVDKELKALKGIDKDSVKVELAGNHATLIVTKLDKKTEEAIRAAVKKAGYTVASVDATAAGAATGTAPTAEKKETKAN